MYNFVFGFGLLATIGLAGSAITYIYQIASTKKSDSERIKNEKAKWIIDNMKSYIQLADQDSDICKSLKLILKSTGVFGQNDAERILYGIVLYFGQYLEFLKKPGLYYFDDLTLEYFLNSLNNLILESYEEFMGDPVEELTALKGRRFRQLVNDPTFHGYSVKLMTWLNLPGNGRRMHLNHLVHYYVLIIGVNKTLLDTYTDSKKLEIDMEGLIDEKIRQEIADHIKKICKDEFENESYFTLFNSKNRLNI
jgi:hypothetical protein